MEKDGTIVGYTVKLKAQAEDQRIRALMTVAVEGNRTDEVLNPLGGDPAVCSLHTTNGRWDIVKELRTDSLEAVDKVLSRIRGRSASISIRKPATCCCPLTKF